MGGVLHLDVGKKCRGAFPSGRRSEHFKNGGPYGDGRTRRRCLRADLKFTMMTTAQNAFRQRLPSDPAIFARPLTQKSSHSSTVIILSPFWSSSLISCCIATSSIS